MPEAEPIEVLQKMEDSPPQLERKKSRSVSTARANGKPKPDRLAVDEAVKVNRLTLPEAFKLAGQRGYTGAQTSFRRDFSAGRLERLGVGMVADGDRLRGNGAQNYIDLWDRRDRP